VRSHSSVTWDDHVSILATFNKIYNQDFNCSRCVLKHPEARRESSRGCSRPVSKAVLVFRDSEGKDQVVFKRCPSNFYNGFVAELIGMCSQFEKGILPYQGGLLDQPAKIIDALNMISGLKMEDELKRAEAMRAKQKKLARSSRGRQ
jgi:hypothetical protein